VDPNAYRQFSELERNHWWFRGRRAVFSSLLRSALPPGPTRRLLDVGCGFGGMLECLAPHGQVFGVDLAPESLGRLRERGFAGAVAASALALPFPDAVFDVVALFDTLEHCDDDGAVARECARCLRPGGIAIVTGPAYPFLYAQNDRVAHHRRRYTRGSLRRVLEGAGLDVFRATYVNSLLFPLILPAVLALKAKERLLPGDPSSTNLSVRTPRLINEALAWIFGAERWIVPRLSLPAGHSLALLGRKA
jgi:SAM-dependent methyltransferase